MDVFCGFDDDQSLLSKLSGKLKINFEFYHYYMKGYVTLANARLTLYTI